MAVPKIKERQPKAVRIEKKMKGSEGLSGKASVVEGRYWNDSMHDKDFSLSEGNE